VFWQSDKELVLWCVIAGASFVAAVFDIRTRRIPNALCGPLFLAGLVRAVQLGRLDGLTEAVIGSVLLAGPFLILFALGKGGAGDAKLMGAIGTWAGLEHGVVVLVCVCVAGAVLAVATAVAGRQLKAVIIGMWMIVRGAAGAVLGGTRTKPAEDGSGFGEDSKFAYPYAAAIFAGVCLAGAFEYLWKAQ